MNINQFLKSVGKMKMDLAKELELSRPTLNQYIDLYEKGLKIENERYDIIFKRLFSDLTISADRFEKKIESARFLLERDRKYDIGSLNPEAADVVARIHNYMVRDMEDELWNRKVYDAILIILSNYRKNDIMRELMSYFSDLNSDSDLAELTQDSKAYYSYYFKYLHGILNSVPGFDKKEYEKFLKRKAELTRGRHDRKIERTKKIKERMSEVLKEVDSELQEKGVEATEEEIMQEVLRRMRR